MTCCGGSLSCDGRQGSQASLLESLPLQFLGTRLDATLQAGPYSLCEGQPSGALLGPRPSLSDASGPCDSYPPSPKSESMAFCPHRFDPRVSVC